MKANLFTLFFIVFISAKSQSKYDFPVELPVYLSGSFAELRPNHFHAGIDIKTRGKTGYKIFSLEGENEFWVTVSRLSIRHSDSIFAKFILK